MCEKPCSSSSHASDCWYLITLVLPTFLHENGDLSFKKVNGVPSLTAESQVPVRPLCGYKAFSCISLPLRLALGELRPSGPKRRSQVLDYKCTCGAQNLFLQLVWSYRAQARRAHFAVGHGPDVPPASVGWSAEPKTQTARTRLLAPVYSLIDSIAHAFIRYSPFPRCHSTAGRLSRPPCQ